MSFGFIGEYSHSVDAKGRMNVPVKFREQLGETFVVTRGLDKCLSIYPTEAFKTFAEKLQSLPISDINARQFVRFFLSGAVECELDKQGRILIPQSLRTHASISKDVVVTGNGSTVEIWDAQKWQEYNDAIDPDAIAENMVSLGI